MSLFGPPNVEKMIAKKNLKGLIKALVYHRDRPNRESPDFERSRAVRRKAAQALGTLGDDSVFNTLLESLRDVCPEVREAGARALARLDIDRTIALLLGRLKPDEKKEWEFTAEALGHLGDARATEPLVALLKEAPRSPLLAAIEALGKLNDARAIPPLIETLGHDDSFVRKAAAYALDRLGQPDWKEWIEGTKQDLVRLGESGDPRALAPLIQALKTGSEDSRKSAALALGILRNPSAAGPLVVALEDREGAVRAAAAQALGPLRNPLAVEPLIKALKDRHRDTRRAAAIALGLMGDTPAVRPLIDALTDDDDWMVRKSAAEALGNLGDSRAIKPLIQALRDSDESVRLAIGEALGKFGEDGIVALLNRVGSGDPEIRPEVIRILGKTGDVRAIEPLFKALTDKSWSARRAAAWALAQYAERQPAAIFDRWDKIAARARQKHNDVEAVFANCSHYGHVDHPHKDTGIGMDFPDKPPNTDF
ncbi:MAG TPA: HEAT repeat domain-containing protein [Acidobacteriota bacterium]|nr:HEAT repeat domain-containing protein [Acidobacteriota bacterium]